MRFPLIFACVLALAACDSSDTSDSQSEPIVSDVDVTHLHRGLQAEPGTLDPHKSIMTDEWAVLRDVFMGLTYPGPDGQPGPGVAQSWSVSKDGLTVTFTLRENQVWSDGESLEADDVVRGLQRLFDPMTASPSAALLYVVKNARAVNMGAADLETLGVRAVDPSTVEIALERPTPNLPEMLAVPFAAPHPDSRRTDVYNGPYVVTDRVANATISLTVNESYTGPAEPSLQQVTYYPMSDDETALRRFQSGETDLHPWYPSDRREWLDENLPGQVMSAPALGVSYLVFNTEQPPFDDVNVRKALAFAIDGQVIAERVLSGAVDQARRFVPAAVSGYRVRSIEQDKQEDLVREGKRLLRRAGFNSDQPLRFDFRVRQTPDDRKVATALQAFWREIDAEASIVTTDLKTHFDDLETGAFAVADAGWALFNAPESYLFLLSPDDAAQLNYGRFDNAEFTSKFRAALKTNDPIIRAALFAGAEAVALEAAGVVPLFHYRVRAVVSPAVKGFVLNPGAINPSVYLRKAAP